MHLRHLLANIFLITAISMAGLLLLGVCYAFAQTPPAAAPQPVQHPPPISQSIPAVPIHLIPSPRENTLTSILPIPNGVRILPSSNVDDQFAASEFAQTLAARGVAATIGTAGDTSFTVEILRSTDAAATTRLAAAHLTFDAPMQPEGYALITAGSVVTIIGATPEGVFYGLQTLKQMVTGSGASAALHGAVIRDWPAMRYRGIQDDLSRGPVPTLEFQKHQIQTFAAYKLNVYSPYFENTYAYISNPLAAPPGGALTPADAAALIAFAKPYHVTIIPEQESFGHLHHLLTWEQYQPLAETPHGDVLAPGQPASLNLITQMFTELAVEFPSPFLHIGADETVELGLGQTQDDVTKRGLGPVYLDFLQQIHSTLTPFHRRLLFWGDIALTSPELLPALPADFKHDMIAVPWQYNPESKGFARYITPFTNAGIETWVSPGVNNWRRVYPNYGMALANIQGFVRDGQSLGATGTLNTVWNDDGEGLFNSDWYGVLFGAAAAWQHGESSIPDFQQSFSLIFHGDQSGSLDEAQQEIITAHALLRDTAKLGDASDSLFWLDPFSRDGQSITAKMRPYNAELRRHAERALTLIAQARTVAALTGQPLRENDAIDALELGARRMDFIGLKFQIADEMQNDYARAEQLQHDRQNYPQVLNALNEIGGINGRMADLRDGYTLLGDLYRQAWLRSNRPYWLGNVTAHYQVATDLWVSRMDQFRTALRQWQESHTLPPATDVGLPPVPAQSAAVH